MNGKVTVKHLLLITGLMLFCCASSAYAVNNSLVQIFYVDQNQDEGSRESVEARLIKETDSLYFYAEKSWWDSQNQVFKQEALKNIDVLSVEFENKIHPVLTDYFGSEWNPGIDNDEKMTILFHAMKEGISGYFRSDDGYYKIQLPNSNEREMVYLAADNIKEESLKASLAHEFVHVINFNQKDRLRNVQEEVWLNEARAEYASALLGYDNTDSGLLQRRVKDFLQNPSVALLEWKNTKYNYAALRLFTYYLVDHYGIKILSNSLKSGLIGIESIDMALSSNGFKESFAQVFMDWTIANIINDCSFGKKYCYLNMNLADLKINPPINFLPLSGDSSLSVKNSSKSWMPNWQKVIGGNGNMALAFQGVSGLNYAMPYILFQKNGTFLVKFMALDSNQKGNITVENFGTDYSSLVIIPLLQSKTAGFLQQDTSYPYTFTVSFNNNDQEENTLVQQLLEKIESLKKQIAALTPNGNGVVAGSFSCLTLNNNLYTGSEDTSDIKCLQQFLKKQGLNIYPEGLVTGYFGNLTKAAVIRFQQKYSIPNTGFVGVLTRTKINQLLSS